MDQHHHASFAFGKVREAGPVLDHGLPVEELIAHATDQDTEESRVVEPSERNRTLGTKFCERRK